MDRDFLDRLARVELYASLARGVSSVDGDRINAGVFDNPDATIAEKLHFAVMEDDDGNVDPENLTRGLEAFDVLPADRRRAVLNGWAPIDGDRVPRGRDVLASLHDVPLARALVFAADVELSDSGRLKEMRCDHYQDWMPLTDPASVQLIVREGTPREHVACVLGRLLNQITPGVWAALVESAPVGAYRRRAGQVWRAYDAGGGFDGYLVTAENDVDRPIAYVCASGDLSDAAAKRLAKSIAESPYGSDLDAAAVDLRTYGYADSQRPTPGFIYGLQVEPLDEDLEVLLTPRPYCRFLAAHLRELASPPPRYDAVDVYEPAHRKSGSSFRLPAPRPASKTSEGAYATAAS